MVAKEIQIVAFNNPYPPDFGGAIDIFYKIKALSNLGVKIYLHIFYDKRDNISGLESYCEYIHMYKRNRSILKHISTLPFSVNSRISKELLINLNNNDAPILFESLRTTYLLNNQKFKHRTLVRCHNIEHDYSYGLFKSEKNWLIKIAQYLEAFKLKHYESVLNKANILLPLSYHDHSYYSQKFKTKSYFLPVFQASKTIESKPGFGKYALYHGDLSISDNIRSVLFLIDVFKDLNKPLVIASSIKAQNIIKELDKYENISYHKITRESELNKLIAGAHINTLFSFQRSGTKLKVFNALYKGRHCIVNRNIVDDPEVLQLCEVVNTKTEYQNAVNRLFNLEFNISEERINNLKKFDAKLNAEKLLKILA